MIDYLGVKNILPGRGLVISRALPEFDISFPNRADEINMILLRGRTGENFEVYINGDRARKRGSHFAVYLKLEEGDNTVRVEVRDTSGNLNVRKYNVSLNGGRVRAESGD